MEVYSMKRRDFLEKVSELAKDSAAAITLSRLQIAAIATTLTGTCSKEKIKMENGNNERMLEILVCDDKMNMRCIAPQTYCYQPKNCISPVLSWYDTTGATGQSFF
jgi:hypothetical protein